MGTAVGATITVFQNLDVIKTPLVNSMSKYDPESKDQEIINLNAAWDDVQAEVITKFILTSVVEWVRFRLGLLSHLQGREFESPFWLSKVNV